MSNLVVANSGERYLLDTTLRTPLAVDERWHVHGYTNDYTPLGDTVLSDYTEVTLPGYAPAELDRSLWPASSTVGGQAASFYGGNPVQLTCSSGSAEVLGYFVTDETDTVLLWAERFDVSQTLDSLHPVQIVIVLAGRSQSEPT